MPTVQKEETIGGISESIKTQEQPAINSAAQKEHSPVKTRLSASFSRFTPRPASMPAPQQSTIGRFFQRPANGPPPRQSVVRRPLSEVSTNEPPKKKLMSLKDWLGKK